MLAKIPSILRITWEQIHRATLARFPDLVSAAELARSSWAKSIESYASVPDVYKSFFEPFSANGGSFPYTALTPSHEKFIHRQTEKIICALTDALYVLEHTGTSFEAQCYPLDGISYVEFRSALLSSSIKICGLTRDYLHSSSTLKFNSVTDYLFAPILKKARPGTSNSREMVRSAESEQFSYLVKVNFKFMNYARHSLLEGENVIHSILQPEIREKVLTVSGRTYYKTTSPTHMSILTDRELILIREEATRRIEDKYGGIWDYISLNKIVSLSFSEKDADLLALVIQLPGSVSFELLYQKTAKEEVNQFVDRLS